MKTFKALLLASALAFFCDPSADAQQGGPCIFTNQLNSASSGAPLEGPGCRYAHIATQATTILKSASGTLHTITVNSAANNTATVTVYDNTAGSGTIIAAIVTTQITTLTFDVGFANGLTIVTSVANPDITINWE